MFTGVHALLKISCNQKSRHWPKYLVQVTTVMPLLTLRIRSLMAWNMLFLQLYLFVLISRCIMIMIYNDLFMLFSYAMIIFLFPSPSPTPRQSTVWHMTPRPTRRPLRGPPLHGANHFPTELVRTILCWHTTCENIRRSSCSQIIVESLKVYPPKMLYPPSRIIA